MGGILIKHNHRGQHDDKSVRANADQTAEKAADLNSCGDGVGPAAVRRLQLLQSAARALGLQVAFLKSRRQALRA